MRFQGYIVMQWHCHHFVHMQLTVFDSMYQVSMSLSIFLFLFTWMWCDLDLNSISYLAVILPFLLIVVIIYLSLLWYCNGFHCQGQITERSQHHKYTFVRRVYYYYSDYFLNVLGSDVIQVGDNCIFIQFIRYKYEINMKWHCLTMSFCFCIFANFLLFRSI